MCRCRMTVSVDVYADESLKSSNRIEVTGCCSPSERSQLPMRTDVKEAPAPGVVQEANVESSPAQGEAPTAHARSFTRVEQGKLLYSERRLAWYRAVARRREEKAAELGAALS